MIMWAERIPQSSSLLSNNNNNNGNSNSNGHAAAPNTANQFLNGSSTAKLLDDIVSSSTSPSPSFDEEPISYAASLLRQGGRLPKELLCPITKKLMQEPVVAADGYT